MLKHWIPPEPTNGYERFLAMCYEQDNSAQVYLKNQYSRYEDLDGFRSDAKLFVEWVSGGTTGGNCWNEGGHYSVDGDPPEDLDGLDLILEKCRPTLGFLEYKVLTKTLIKLGSRHQSEYYDNSTDYMSKTIVLQELYNYLLEKGWLPEEYA